MNDTTPTPNLVELYEAWHVTDLLIIGAVITGIVMAYSYRDLIWAWLSAVWSRYAYVERLPADENQIAISPHQDAVKENAEIGKPAGPSPVELDRMLADARYEALARAVGTLAGAGIIPAGSRSQALLALGIEGRRYQRLKPLVDAAQAAVQAEQAPPAAEPRVITVAAGRPDERELLMEPAP